LREAIVCRDWFLPKIISYAKHAKKITYQPGDVIYSFGEHADFVYFVLSGNIDLELFYCV
jgi:CRP-like cAMP-binding protein